MKRFCWLVFWLLAAVARGGEGTLPSPPDIPAGRAFTFVVMGDNRGTDDGEQPPTFIELLGAVKKERPDFVINTGDMIYGRSTNETTVREEWRKYFAAIAGLKAPVYHVPGNHDIWSFEQSRAWYREFCGPSYYSFDCGGARFIGLDTETEKSRIGPEQLAWLKDQLAGAGERPVFLFFHQPLYPVDGHIGASLDVYPDERDRLHALFKLYRDNIKGVFEGHEHLYHFEKRDGVPYYITGGAGAELYVAPELGGFHHYLLVNVIDDRVTVELKKVGPPEERLRRPVAIEPGQLLESWENGQMWSTWNNSVTAGAGVEGGLRFNYDLAQCDYPLLELNWPTPRDLRKWDALTMVVTAPRGIGTNLSITTELAGAGKHSTPPVQLHRGTNNVSVDLNGAWLPAADRGAIQSLDWIVTAEGGRRAGSLLFENCRLERNTGIGTNVEALTLDSWTNRLSWRVADESVTAEPVTGLATDGRKGLKVNFDFSKTRKPVLLTRLNPPWDLSGAGALSVDVYVPADMKLAPVVGLGLRADEVEHQSGRFVLRAGWNTVKVPLEGDWLPHGARERAEQVEWTLYSASEAVHGWVVFDNLRAEAP